MDNIIITYLIKVSISLALFYGLYMLFLKKDTFLQLRRFYFLFTILFSFLLPFLSIEIPLQRKETSQLPVYWLSQIEIGNQVAVTAPEPSLVVWRVFLIVFSIVAIFLILKFTLQLLSIVKLRLQGESEKTKGFCIVKLKDKRMSPFSFFNWIFINSNIYSVEELNEIVAHEQVHVRQYHSIDVILSELICVCFWWNPFVWLLKKEIKLNLEYLADEGVLQAGFDSKGYQYVLLQVSNRSTGIPLINNFNVSQLKKRIMMMNKTRSSIFLSVKYLLIIPVGIALLLGNAVQASPELVDMALDKASASIQQKPQSKQEPQKKGDVYVTVEKMPMYPGGEPVMQNFIGDNLKYPIEAQNKGIQGRVTIRFIVRSTGDIEDVTVVRGIDPVCDAEAVRVIKAMPKWTPGKQRGKAVDVYYTLPIVFRLTNGLKSTSNVERKDKSLALTNKDSKEEKLYSATVNYPKENSKKEDKPMNMVEKMPSYPGGEAAMHKFISDNMKYPVEALNKGIQGRVTIRFVVQKTGEITDVTLVRGIDPACDAEAIRVIKAMPKWIPGRQKGEAVSVFFTIPMVFRLKTENKNTTK